MEGQRSLDDARDEMSQLTGHLEALMLTNQALIDQLTAARERACSVNSSLSDSTSSLDSVLSNKRGRDGDVDEDQPQYRSACVAILSSDAGPTDEFDDHDLYEDEVPATYRSCSAEPGDLPPGADDDGALDEVAPCGFAKLGAVKEAVAAIGALAASGSADDLAVQAALERLASLGL
jgi:hypothetical protein